MSNNFVTLALKSVIDESQLLEFQNLASLVLEHYSSNSRLYGRALNRTLSNDVIPAMKKLLKPRTYIM